MDRENLVKLLSEMAAEDLESGADIFDHPCSIAVRAIEKSFEDINVLLRVIRSDTMGRSKKVQMLIGLPYDPEW